MGNTKKKSSTKFLLFLLLVVLIVVVVFVIMKSNKQPAPIATKDETTTDIDSTLVEDEVEKHLQAAQKLFLQGEMKAAAAEIRKSASALKPKIELVPEETEALQKTIDDLENLANSVEQGTFKKVDQLKNAFSATELRLAEFYRKIAIKAWAEKNYKRAGEALKYSTNYLKRAADWSGEKIETGFTLVINNARQLGKNLLQGAGFISDEVKDGLDNVGKEIDKLNNRLTNKKEKK